jgi:myosin-5
MERVLHQDRVFAHLNHPSQDDQINADNPYALCIVNDATQPDAIALTTIQDKQTLKRPLNELLPANPASLDDAHDIGSLSHLNEPALLHVVAARYHRQTIYTKAGPVLIALNPFQRMPQLYADALLDEYARASADAASGSSSATLAAAPPLAPHLYQLAGAAFYNMRMRGKSQSVVINGESGAGKTESAKIILSFVMRVSIGGAALGEQLTRRLSASNVVLEAFGNAKTLRNHNSSRFGKLLQLDFSAASALQGARISRFLLEKSRVATPETGERSFHVFYELCAGAPAAERERLRLTEAGAFAYLARGECVHVDGIDDSADFRSLCAALAEFAAGDGGSGLGLDIVWSCCAAVLHLGNVELQHVVVDEDEPSSGVSAIRGSFSGGGGSSAGEPEIELTPTGEEHLGTAASLLGCEAATLRGALTSRTIAAGAELCVLSKTLAQAEASRDALAKAIYERLFDAIVEALNEALATVPRGGGGGGPADVANSIGILDIFGSEVFDTNGFEQLLINYANEKLQAHFTATAIGLLQAEYVAQGIDMVPVDYKNNAETVRLLEGRPMSVLATLDDQCLQAGATDESLVAALHASFDKHDSYSKPRFGQSTAFEIRHFGGTVRYEAWGFLVKNKDTLFAELPATMRNSTLPFVGNLFKEAKPAAAAKPSDSSARGRRGGARPRATQFVSVGAQFRDSIGSLVAILESTESHFVRCVKPNERRAAFELDYGTALIQLRSCAVLEAVRVSQAGFPTRIPFVELLSRYSILLPRAAQPPPKPHRVKSSTSSEALGSTLRADTEQLLRLIGVGESEYMLGRTIAYLGTGVLARCEARRLRHLDRCFAKIQARLRGRAAVVIYKRLRQAARHVQRTHRARIVREERRRRQADAAAAAEAAAVSAASEAAAKALAESVEAEALAASNADAVPPEVAMAEWAAAEASHVASTVGVAVAAAVEAAAERDAEVEVQLREELNESLEHLHEVISEREQLEGANYALHEQLQACEEELELNERENADLQDQLVISQRALAEAKEEQIALFREVRELRARVDERDQDITQLLLVNGRMMERLADEGFASPLSSVRVPPVKPMDQPGGGGGGGFFSRVFSAKDNVGGDKSGS